MNALNKSFHADNCFVCSECKGHTFNMNHLLCSLICLEKLDGKFYASKEGNLLCEQHYFEETGRVCGGCGKPIIAGSSLNSSSRYLTYSGKIVTMKADGKYPEVRFHRDHFNCTYCHKNLAGEKYKRTKGRQYCGKCHLELFE